MADTAHATILLVEDDENTRSLLHFILSRAGYHISMAVDGEQALNCIRTIQPPGLVLLDVMMPYHDGFEILEAIKIRESWHKVPVIMLTGRDNEEDIASGFEHGIDDYVTKPFKPAELIARIHRLITPDGQ
ncbi:MAG: response regulator [Gammaproteobacteria bacterium]|jgi:DNA-binding response OmpR family regulator